ncbi:MAG: hypothetical protein AB7Q17_08425 [Phycisphaerae bacterium]
MAVADPRLIVVPLRELAEDLEADQLLQARAEKDWTSELAGERRRPLFQHFGNAAAITVGEFERGGREFTEPAVLNHEQPDGDRE